MKILRKTISKILLMAFIATYILSAYPGFSFAASHKTNPVVLTGREKSEIIVKYNDNSKANAIRESVSGKLKLKKLELKKRTEKSKLDVLEIDKKDDINRVISELKKDKNIKYVQPNYPLQINEITSDEMFGKQWGLLNNGQSVEGLTGRSNVDINAVNAWNITQGSDTVVIGVLDTGVDINHLDLKNNIVPGWDFVNNDATVYDDPSLDLHGTQVAGIIAAEANSIGIKGVAPNVKIMPLKFIRGSTGYTSDAIDAIEFAMEHGVQIINCSFGGSDDNFALKDSMQNSGILFVCSAGNRGADSALSPVYPACFDIPNVLSVAALDSKGVLANFSSYGSAIDVAAPGVNIITTVPGDEEESYDYISGTSASAPFVTGIAALLKSNLPNLTIAQIASRIKQNVVPCTNLLGKVSSGGRVDAYAALTNTIPDADEYDGPGNDVDTAPPGQEDGDTDSWYTTDQLAKIKERLHYGASGVNPGSGNFSFTVNDMSVSAPGFTINISRSYNSKDNKSALMGRGWTFGFEGSAKGSDLVTVILPNGAVERFRQNIGNTGYTAEDSRSTFVRDASDNSYVLTTKDQYTYGFNSSGWLSWMKDRNGNIVNITVDSNGKVTKISDTVGRDYTVNYKPDKPSLICSITDIENRTITYEYDNKDRLSTVTDPMGGKMYYEYDSIGFLNKIKDHNGKLVEAINYNHAEGENQHKVSQATDTFGCVVNYAYDMLNKKTTITDMNSRVSTYWFDNSMYTIKVQDPDGKATLTEYYIYGGKNKYGDIRSMTDRNGNRTEFNIDGRGNVIKRIHCTNGSSSEMGYDDKNNLIWEKDECGKYTYYVYDTEKTNLLKMVQPLNGTDAYIDGTSNANNYAITGYTYYTKAEALQQFNCNAAGLLKSIEDPENKITSYTYDRDGNLNTVKDAENKTTSYEYNRIGWKTAEISAKGYRTDLTYDENGQLEKAVNVTGTNTSRTIYNLLGQKIQEVQPGQYNAADDNIGEHEYNNAAVGFRYEYHDSGKLKKVIDPEGYTTSYDYDCYGNLITELRQNGSAFHYSYDVMDRLVKTSFKENANAAEVVLSEISYAVLDDGKSQKTETKYLNASEEAVTVSIYDFAGRLIEQQNPDGTKIKSGYNPNGTVDTTTNTDGSTAHYKYDGQNRLSEQWTPFEVNDGNARYTYAKIEYFKNGWKKSESVGKEKVGFEQPAANLITINYTYYENGKLQTVTDNENRKTEYLYDNDGNVVKEDVYTDAVNKLTTEYVYNSIGKVENKKQHIRTGDLFNNTFTDHSNTILITSYTYDLNGNLKTLKTPNQIITTYDYDNLGRQTKVSTPGKDEHSTDVSIETSTEYDFEGKPLLTKDAKGNETEYEYDKRGFLIRVTNALGGMTSFDYDLAGRKTLEVSPKNYEPLKALNEMARVEYIYDVMGRVKAKKDVYLDPVTSQWVTLFSKTYKYDNSGNIVKELDALGYEAGTGTTLDERINSGYGTKYTYNTAGKAITVTDAVSQQRALPYTVKYEYDAICRKISETNAKGVATLYEYDSANNILSTKVKKNQSSAEQSISSSTYDLAGRQISHTDGNNVTVSFQYNALGKVSSAAHPGDETIDAYTVTYQYDAIGNLKKQIDSIGKVDLYDYDNQGRMLLHTQQNLNGTQSINIQTKYDKNGNKRFETDGEDTTAESIYDALNRLIETKVTVSCIPHSTAYGYDANSNQTTVTDWRGNTSTNIYDPLNRVIEKQDAYGTIQRLEYDKNNLQSKSYDALGNCTVFSYDRNGRLLSTTDPEGHTTGQAYDDAGNIQTKTDGRNIATTYKYDELSRLKSVANAKGEVTGYTYDLNGNLLTQTDGKGNTTIFQYNKANKLIKKIDPNGTGNPEKTESYTYNPDGSMKNKTDRNGKTTNYSYDIHGRLLNQTIESSVISYTYDNNGNQLTMTDSTGTTIRTYDEINRVLTKQVPDTTGEMSFQYDITAGIEAGCIGEKSTDQKGNITLRIFDKTGRLYKVTADGGTTVYEYYQNGSRKSVTYPSGAKEEYTYYNDGLLQKLINKKANGSIMDEYTYTYDAAHNQTTKHELVNGADKGTTSYTYDSLNRLETVTEPGRTTGYTYDRAGNRLSETVNTGGQIVVTTYTYNEQNRLIKTTTQSGNETERVTYQYDNNGNMLAKNRLISNSVPSGNISGISGYIKGQSMENYGTIYRYDVWNQLIKTIEADKTVTYAYNGEGYRVEKAVNGSLTRFIYESDKVILETDAAGIQTGRNVYGLNLLSRTTGGETLWYMYNGHADVTALIGTDGTTAATYYYDAFGNITEQTGSVNNSITYAGYQYDSESDLYYLNARYYDSKIARFLTEDTYRGNTADPLSLNLYTYCVNNPIRYWDPTGHVSIGVGSKGDGVVAIQEMLDKLGYNTGGADGIFGKNTQAAVLQYQKDHGLQVDGIIGNQTLTTLKTNVAVQNAPTQIQQTAMASAAKAQVGGIKDDAILMSTKTFNNTITAISTLQKSTGGTVNTTVVGNQVVVTGVTPAASIPPPLVAPQKSTTTPSVNINQGVVISENKINPYELAGMAIANTIALYKHQYTDSRPLSGISASDKIEMYIQAGHDSDDPILKAIFAINIIANEPQKLCEVLNASIRQAYYAPAYNNQYVDIDLANAFADITSGYMMGTIAGSAVGSIMKLEGVGKGIKASNLDDIFENPNLLKNMTQDEVKALANKEGWQVGSLSKGSQAGNGLTIRDGKDRLIQWHPGGGHHGTEPYWKVSSGSTGTQRIGPQFENPNGGGASR